MSATSWFFAYDSIPALRAETLRDTAAALVQSGMGATTWQDLDVDGTLIIDAILEAIDSSDVLLADISTMNFNVLFELGYAISRSKHIALAMDTSESSSSKHWSEVRILESVGRIDYEGNSYELSNRCQTSISSEPEKTPLLAALLVGGQPRKPNAVFAPSVPTPIQSAIHLDRHLNRNKEITVLGAGDDLVLAPLKFYVGEIYRSSAAVVHLLKESRKRAHVHNARASLLAGIAAGFEIPVLMVAEDGFVAPLDYKERLAVYSTSAELITIVDRWLKQQSPLPQPKRRVGRFSLVTELPINTFGQYVAEYEESDLDDYFVETSEFRAIMDGDVRMFIGRKGTGKTATMSQACRRLRQNKRNLVIDIRPSAFEMSSLFELFETLSAVDDSEYLPLSIWTYLLHSEIAVEALQQASSRAAGFGGNACVSQLYEYMDEIGICLNDDLASRLEGATKELQNSPRRPEETTQHFIARVLKLGTLKRLRQLTLEVITGYDRIAVLIDNLDKNWERSANYRLLARFIQALLTAAGRVEKDFGLKPAHQGTMKVTLSIFLRTDIYDSLMYYSREPDKSSSLSVRWSDPELLVRVLQERYVAKNLKGVQACNMWEELFDPEVRGLTTRDYFLWRTLPRPRDFIYFANAAIGTAVNRQHESVTADDILFAERQYSQFAVEALVVESEPQPFDLEELLYEFAGLSSTISRSELRQSVECYGDPETIETWLLRTSFIGANVREGEFVHVEGDNDARRKVKLAERHSIKTGSEVLFRVHPAFRPALEITDDDLHDDGILDVTLNS